MHEGGHAVELFSQLCEGMVRLSGEGTLVVAESFEVSYSFGWVKISGVPCGGEEMPGPDVGRNLLGSLATKIRQPGFDFGQMGLMNQPAKNLPHLVRQGYILKSAEESDQPFILNVSQPSGHA